MLKKLKIGFLAPFSGIYPHYNMHINAGLLSALHLYRYSASQIEIHAAYIGQGNRKEVNEAVQKLLFFDGVDLIIGVLNIKVLHDVKSLLENFGKLGLFIDFGELIPPDQNLGNNVGSISMNYWQSEYALGRWAVNNYGKDGQIILPFFESGYNLGYSFLQGAGDSGSNCLNQMVIKNDLVNKNQLNFEPFFQAINEEEPNFVHTIFNGSWGLKFLIEWKNSKFSEHIPLLVIENMAYDDLLVDVQHLNLEFYSTSCWSKEDQKIDNKKFISQFQQLYHQPVSIFSMLGYELGIVISHIFQELLKGDISTIRQKLNTNRLTGPRGEICINGFTNPQYKTIDIIKVKTNHQSIQRTILDQTSATEFNTIGVYEKTVSGFLNPYFSI